VLIKEWNEYLDYELKTLTRAILGAVPAASMLGGFGGAPTSNVIKLTDPEQVGGFFDALNKGNS